jgi:hypothetical protein
MSIADINLDDIKEVDGYFVGIPEGLTPGERLQITLILSEREMKRIRTEFRAAHSHWTERQIRIGILRELHGDTVADEVDRNWNPAWEKLPPQ